MKTTAVYLRFARHVRLARASGAERTCESSRHACAESGRHTLLGNILFVVHPMVPTSRHTWPNTARVVPLTDTAHSQSRLRWANVIAFRVNKAACECQRSCCVPDFQSPRVYKRHNELTHYSVLELCQIRANLSYVTSAQYPNRTLPRICYIQIQASF